MATFLSSCYQEKDTIYYLLAIWGGEGKFTIKMKCLDL